MDNKKARFVLGAVTLFSTAILAQTFPTETTVNAATIPASSLKVSSKINSRIAAGHYNTPAITTELHTFEMFNYTSPEQLPNGIVFHYTDNANNYSARSEADYEINGGWENAFVHTFIDHNTILNIHDTNYGAWGAGPYANHRFVQFELVSARNATEFAESINNAAWYTAYICHRYGLPLTLASQVGNAGGIWTHHNVTTLLGGTDHTDPDAYLAKWGYSLAQFLDLVKAYSQTQHFADSIITQKNVDYTALINESKRNDGMFSNAPYKISGAKLAGYAKTYNGQSLQAVAEARTQRGTWVKLKLPSGAYVWMDKQGTVKYSRIKSQKEVNYPVEVQQNGRNDMMFVNSPYGVLGAKKYQYANTVNGQTFTAVKEATVGDGNVKWVQLKLTNGTLVWLDKRGVRAYSALSNQHTVAYDAQLSHVTKSDGLFKNQPYNVVGSSLYALASKYRNQDVSVIAEASTGSTTWAQVRLSNGQTVWVNKAVLKAYPTIADEKNVNQSAIISKVAKNDGLFQNAPYGTKGYKLYALASNYQNQAVTIKKTGTVGSVKWAYVTLKNGVSVWINANCLKSAPVATLPSVKITSKASYAATIATVRQNDGLFANGPYHTAGYKLFALAKQYQGQTVTVMQTGVAGGVEWAQIKLANGSLYWINAGCLSKTANLTVTSTTQKTATITAAAKNDGLFANNPYGVAGSRLYGYAKQYLQQNVTILKEAKTKSTAWAQIRLSNGATVWIASRLLTVKSGYTVINTNQYQAQVNTASAKDAIFANAPYGAVGAKNIGALSQYKGQLVTVQEEATTKSAHWVLAKFANGVQGWIDKAKLVIPQSLPANTSALYQTKLSQAGSRDYLFSQLGGNATKALSPFNGQNVSVLDFQTRNAVYWAKVQLTDGTTGWVDQRLLTKGATNNFGMKLTALSATQRAFALQVAQAAIKVGKQYGVYPSIILAQAAGETGWGTSQLAQSAYNLFGIKADSSWTGAKITVSSPEVINGKTVKVNSAFRKYASIEASVADYAVKVTGSAFYSRSLRSNSADALSACTDLKEWATDPNYVTTLQNRIKTYAMNALDNL